MLLSRTLCFKAQHKVIVKLKTPGRSNRAVIRRLLAVSVRRGYLARAGMQGYERHANDLRAMSCRF